MSKDQVTGAGENTLLISYLFPPAGGVGVQRAISYAKYLGQAGCPVIVLTTRNPVTAWQDPSLLETLPKDLVIERALTLEPPFRVREWIRKFIPKPPTGAPRKSAKSPGGISTKVHELLSPDPQKFWVPLAYRKAVRIVKERKIRNVLVNAPPFSSLEIGVRLKARFPHITLISEFRDEWLNYYLGSDPNASVVRRQHAVELESRTVRASDYIVTVTESWRNQIRDRYPDQPNEKFVSVPNGFDPQVFEGFRNRPNTSGKLIIGYMGTVYWNKVYSPEPLLDALAELPAADRASIEMRFVGKVAEEAQRRLSSAAVQVLMPGFLPQYEALRYLEDADCLLLVVNNKTALAAKLFEYFSTGKPVLALSPKDGEVERLMQETGVGWCVDPTDQQRLKQVLQILLDIFVRGDRSQLPKRRAEAIARYARPRLVDQLTRATGIGSHRCP